MRIEFREQSRFAVVVRAALLFFIAVSIFMLATQTNPHAQESLVTPFVSPTPTPPPQPSPADDQDEVRIRTEEVRVPVTARDEFGNFDPTLAIEDVLVFEDEVPQTIRSVSRLPANVVVLLDAGGERNPSMRIQTTRDVALNLIGRLRAEDAATVIQFNNRGVETLQAWTIDKTASVNALRRRLRTGTSARLTEAMRAAALALKERATGNRHVVLITDGVEANRNSVAYTDALRELNRAQATVHIISYTQLARAETEGRGNRASPQSERDRIVDQAVIGVDPTSPHSTGRGGAPATPGAGAGNVARFSLSEILRRRALRRAVERSEAQLQTLAEEMGGRVYLPRSTSEMIAQGAEVAREIGAQYTLTYTPRRPLAGASAAEYRRLRVVARRPNLQIQVRRGYVVSSVP